MLQPHPRFGSGLVLLISNKSTGVPTKLSRLLEQGTVETSLDKLMRNLSARKLNVSVRVGLNASRPPPLVSLFPLLQKLSLARLSVCRRA